MDEGTLNDTELHLAAQRDNLHLAAQQGDLTSVKHILDEIKLQIVGTSSGADFDAEVAKIRACMVNEVGETALYKAAEKGHLEVVKELLKYSDKETLTRRNAFEFDPLHIAASEGHDAIVKLLLDHDESLCQTRSKGNATPLVTAASKGHVAVIKELLSKDPSLLYIPKSNGKNALHMAARSGHVKTVKSLLEKDPQLARVTDKTGQTALHMAVKGASCEVVKLLLEADAAIAMLPDKSGLTALHVATRKKRAEIVNELLRPPVTDVNALTKDHKTALDIAEGLSSSKKLIDIRACLIRHGAVRANELNKSHDEVKNTITQIKNDIHTIAKEVRKLHREGINNTSNLVTVAVLFAMIAFAAMFTVPGGDNNVEMAIAVHRTCYKIFYVFNTISLHTSLAVVVIHISLEVRGEKKAEKGVVEAVNRLMWFACVCTSVALMASSYIVIGRKHEGLAVSVTVFGGVIMMVVLGMMASYVVKWKRNWSIGG
ncbi:hypothetical protein R6Q59_029700 [Mikania micrantha]